MTNAHYIRKNAIIYERYKDNFDNIRTEEILLFRQEIRAAYGKIPVMVGWQSGQPYQNVSELTKDIKDTNRMYISTDHNESRLLPEQLNMEFRAVHDYLHYTLQAPFTAAGEIKVFHLQKKLHSSEIGRKILFSEVVLQACYQEHFGHFAPTQKVILL